MKKLVIGICDDEILILHHLMRILQKLLEDKGILYEIHSYLSGKELICDSPLLDVVFLDIQMPDLDGIETGKELKKMNPKCKIIMATNRIDRFKESFQIEALRFITKPFNALEIDEAINALLKQELGTDNIELYRDRNLYSISQRNIEYIKAYDGYLVCKCHKGTFRNECSLKTIYEKLDKRLFVKISRSFIVNMLFISKYNNGYIYLPDDVFKVSRREKKNFEKQWIFYDLYYK